MLNLYIPRITAMAEGQGGLPSMLTSGTAIVVYIFLILTIIAVSTIVVFAVAGLLTQLLLKKKGGEKDA